MSRDELRPVLTATDIMRLLPHRYPFLLVDRVDEIIRGPGPTRAGTRIRAIKNVTFNEQFFVGHFPHRPVMPGVLQIEAMAQVAALACASLEPGAPQMDVAIAAVDGCRFRKPVGPGDTLEIEAEIVKDRGQILVLRTLARVRGEIVSEAELMAKMFPLEKQ
jgi:3-hydroxyacyl-[acyl-carrier-protein] dehydratase